MDTMDLFVYGIAGLVLFILVILICRNLMTWYCKINDRIENQKEIIELLKEIKEGLKK